jgi:hypothetical protein
MRRSERRRAVTAAIGASHARRRRARRARVVTCLKAISLCHQVVELRFDCWGTAGKDRLMPGTYPLRRGIRWSRLDGRAEVGRIGVSGASDQTKDLQAAGRSARHLNHARAPI